MGYISCHITPLVIDSLRGTHIHINTHTDLSDKRLMCARFKNCIVFSCAFLIITVLITTFKTIIVNIHFLYTN